MKKEPCAVIMAGGRGERFWPKSRLSRPKHLLPIVGEEPMLRQTLNRLEGLIEPERTWIITNSEQADAVREICPDLPAAHVVAEPVGRDTAPAVALSAILVAEAGGDAPFVMLPSDHVIHDGAAFRADLEKALEAASREERIATVGIVPTFPATGYGYIRTASGETATDWVPVEAFVEKPDLPTAQGYLEEGGYFWNGGIFAWKPSTILHALQNFQPSLFEAINAIRKRIGSGEELSTILTEAYPKLEKISIDYAVMEHADNIVMVPANFDWDDVGSWPAVARHFPEDEQKNVVRGTAEILEGKGNIVSAEDGHLVGLIGVENLLVIQTGDATLVCPKDRAEEVKKLVKTIGKRSDGSRFL